MDNDLNTPKAIAVLMEAVTEANRATDATERCRLKAQLLACGRELGILQQEPRAWFEASISVQVDSDRVEEMITARNEARAARNWARADAIRDELAKMGVQIKDGPNGTQWRAE